MPLRLRVIPQADHRRLAKGDLRPPSGSSSSRTTSTRSGSGGGLDVELSLPFKALSGLHARLRRQGSGGGERSHTWVIEDLESKNGTFVGKSRIKPGEHRLLSRATRWTWARQGDVRRPFAADAERGRDRDDRAPAGQRPVRGVARRERADAVGDLGGVERDRVAEARSIATGRTSSDATRAATCPSSTEELSRQHASFTRTWNGVVLRDLGSKNGILVERQSGDGAAPLGRRRGRDGAARSCA